MKRSHKILALAFSVLIILTLSSCSRVMGYGVLLWSLPEHGLYDGDVVPVYVRSNISHTFIIGTLNEEERIEVPLWQITDPLSKKKAEKKAERYAEYQHIYARVVLDGLPMRKEPVNISDQVYRFRENEIIKVLYKGEGAAVMSGSNAMEGDWLRVMANDGTMGWCFSYNLRLFDETQVTEKEDTEQVKEEDPVLTAVMEASWYPEDYLDMIRRERIDLNRMTSVPAVNFKKDSGEVSFKVEDDVLSFKYTDIEKTSENNYKFTGSPLSMTVKSPSVITMKYPNENGLILSSHYVTLEKSVNTILEEEKERRQSLYLAIRGRGSKYVSSNYGTLQFLDDNRFVWSGYQLLSPNLIPKNSGSTGTVSFDYFLDSSLGLAYTGAFTFTFEKSGAKVVFLYSIEENGIRIEDATKALIKHNVIKSRNPSPLVMFFSAE